jgi:hypothetical protein
MLENHTEKARPGTVRVHIDQYPVESPNPTTGTALYSLAGIPQGLELFREVEGNQEDQIVANDGHELRLTQDEHFHSGKDRNFRIIVNLEEKTVAKKVLTFWEVVRLAYPPSADGPMVVYTVTFKKAAGPRREGTLEDGQTVEIKNGTVFNVRRTDRS